MTIVEIAHYRLRQGADDAALLAAEAEIQQAVGPSHPGYQGRELLKSADGTYVLIMRWENQQAADSWNGTLFQSPAGPKLGALVDPSSMSRESLTALVPA